MFIYLKETEFSSAFRPDIWDTFRRRIGFTPNGYDEDEESLGQGFIQFCDGSSGQELISLKFLFEKVSFTSVRLLSVEKEGQLPDAGYDQLRTLISIWDDRASSGALYTTTC